MEEELREELRDCNLALDNVIQKLEDAHREIDEYNKQIKSIQFTMMIFFIILFVFLIGIIIIFISDTKKILCNSFF